MKSLERDIADAKLSDFHKGFYPCQVGQHSEGPIYMCLYKVANNFNLIKTMPVGVHRRYYRVA